MPSCKDIDAQIVDWLYDELDASGEASFREHIDSCPTCSVSLASFSQIRELMRELPRLDPPVAVSNIVLHEAAKQAPAKPGSTGRTGLWASLLSLFQPLIAHPAMAAAATLMLAVTVGGVMYLRGGPQTTNQTSTPSLPAIHTPQPEAARGAKEHRGQPSASGESAPLKMDDARSTTTDKTVDIPERKRRQTGTPDGDGYSVDVIPADQRATLEQMNSTPAAPSPASKTAGKRSSSQPSPLDSAPKRDNKPAFGDYTRNAISSADEEFAEKPDDDINNTRAEDEPTSGQQMQVKGTSTNAPGGLLKDLATDSSSTLPPPPATAKKKKKPAKTAPRKRPVPRRESATGASTASPTVAQGSLETVQASDGVANQARSATRLNAWSESQHSRLLTAINSKRCQEAATLANDLRERDRKYYAANIRSSTLGACGKLVAKESTRRAKRANRKRAKSKRSDQAAPAESDAKQAAD